MTLQTPVPLERAPLHASNREGRWFKSLRQMNAEAADTAELGGLELDAPYQRGEVWTLDQRRLLIKSFALGVPIPAVVVNDRAGAGFCHADGSPDWRYAIVDGKQRVTTLLAWYDGQLDVPASWFIPDWVSGGHPTDDGTYVYVNELTEVGARLFHNRMLIPVAEGKLPTLREEAELYLLLNRGGTAHDDSDLDTARAITGTRPT